MKVNFVNNTSTMCLWCSRGSNTSKDTMTAFLLSKKIRFDRNTSINTYSAEVAAKTDYEIVTDYDAMTFKINDVEGIMDSGGQGDFAPASYITLFASHTAGSGLSSSSFVNNFGEYYLYYFRAYDKDDNLICELLPARNESTGEFGLFNTVSSQFLLSANGVSFLGKGKAITVDEENKQYIVNVFANSQDVLTDEEADALVAGQYDLVKEGEGELVLPNTVFASIVNDIYVKNGILQVQGSEEVEARETKANVFVSDGATAAFNCGVRTVKSKSFHICGSGYNGNGALWAIKGDWNSIGGCAFYLTGDTLIRQDYQINWYDGFYLNGHNLKFWGSEKAVSWGGFSPTFITNNSDIAATVIIDNTQTKGGVAWQGNADNKLCVTNNGKYHAKYDTYNKWTFYMQHTSAINPDNWTNTTDVVSTGRIQGPIDFSGDVKVTLRTNSVAALTGKISGSGTITVDGGWLNLKPSDNTYSGDIIVAGKAVHEPEWRAGLGLHNAMALGDTRSVTLKDGVLELPDGDSPMLPYIISEGDNITNKVFGGNANYNRSNVAGIYKTGNGVLEIDSPLNVTGKLAVVAGEVDIKNNLANFVGNAGLMGGWCYNDTMEWGFYSPTATSDKGVTPVYDTYYRYGLEHMHEANHGKDGNHARFHFAHGYIWNRTGESATWTFIANYNDRVHMWLDGEKIMSDKQSYSSIAIENRITTVSDIAPGAHEIYIIVNANAASPGANQLNGVYAAIGIDWQGRASSDFADYEKLTDPGDGSVFTTDTETSATDDRFRAVLADVEFAVGTKLYCHGAPYSVSKFAGSPQIVEAPTWTVRDIYKINMKDFVGKANEESGLTVDGTLVIGKDCVFTHELCDEADLPGLKSRLSNGGHIVIARADSIQVEDRLRCSPELDQLNVRVYKLGNELIVRSKKGIILSIR